MKKHKEYKVSSTLFYLASVLFYISAIIIFVGGNHNSMAVVWLCLGSSFLCFGSLHKKKADESEKDSKQE